MSAHLFFRRSLTAILTLTVLSCGGRKDAEVTLSVSGDLMKFDTDLIRIPKDSHVKLSLINKSTLPTMRHNILIYDLQGEERGKAMQKLGDMAMKIGEGGGYIPSVPGIIAASKLADPGQTVVVEFDSPPAGEYLFMCTFQPAHFMTMNGKFIVE